jgi:hypothetical protein
MLLFQAFMLHLHTQSMLKITENTVAQLIKQAASKVLA